MITPTFDTNCTCTFDNKIQDNFKGGYIACINACIPFVKSFKDEEMYVLLYVLDQLEAAEILTMNKLL